MNKEIGSYKVQIVLALIGLVGILATAIFSNFDKIFPQKVTVPTPMPTPTPTPTPISKCTAPWQWDTSMQSCVKKVTISGKSYSISLDKAIRKVDGRIDYYLNTKRLKGTDDKDRAMYHNSRGTVQVVIPIMQGKTMVGDMIEVIYSTSDGGICSISNLNETTGWLKRMRVRYITLLSDCGKTDKTCSTRIDSSQKRVHIRTKPLMVTISKNC